MIVSYLRDKHAAESHRCTETYTKAHSDDLIIRAKVNGYKGQPDDTSGVHGKGNVLGLIEVSWHISSLLKKKTKGNVRQLYLGNLSIMSFPLFVIIKLQTFMYFIATD